MSNEIILQHSDFIRDYKSREFINGYDDRSDVLLEFRDSNFEKFILRITNYDWYFCILTEDAVKHESLIVKLKNLQKIKKLEHEGIYTKIYCQNLNSPRLSDCKTYILREFKTAGIQTYEADLNSYQRFVIDEDLKIASKYKILYFDIETDDRGKGIEVGRDQILSIAAVNEDAKVYYKSTNDEKELLKWFKDLMQKYDMICGWNSEKFDVPYVKKRMQDHDIYFNWRTILQLDLMQKTIGLNKKNAALIKEVRSFSLNSVSKYFLKEQKVEHEESIYELFSQKPEKLKEYNVQDCMLLLKLDNKLHLTTQQIVESNITGTFLNEFSVSRVLDTYILRQASKENPRVRFTSKPEKNRDMFDSNRESNYVGGLVLDPVSGIHKKVFHFDFTSLYPSIIKTFNISPETLLPSDFTGDCITAPNGAKFKRGTGIIPKIIVSLLDARNRIRKGEMKKYAEGTPEYENLYYQQYAFKTMANSFYGILGASFTRYYRIQNAEAITLSGHYLISCVKAFCEIRGAKVIYGDTDSVFVLPEEGNTLDADEYDKEINDFLKYHLCKTFNVYESSIIDIKTEAVYEKMCLWGRKKKYVKLEEGKLKYMGIEAKRRETLPFGGNAQLEMFNKLLLEDFTGNQIWDWVQDLQDRVINQGVLKKEDLVLQVKLSKSLDDYRKKVKDKFGNIIDYKPSKLAHVNVALWLKENGITDNGRNTWEPGEYVKFIISKGYHGIEAVSVYNYTPGVEDRRYYWNVKIWALLERPLLELFPELDWDSFTIKVEKPKKEKVVREKKKKKIQEGLDKLLT